MNNIVLTGENHTFTNQDIAAESFVLDEVLCSTGSLSFGSCEANSVKLKIRHSESVIGQEFSITFNGANLGLYTVIEDKPTANRCYRNLVLADRLYFILNSDMTSWYNDLTFPMNLKSFRDAFFDAFEIDQEEVDLPMDDLIMNKITGIESITGQKILTDICQLNGCFGNMNRSGKFDYIWLERSLVPDEELLPSDDLYPGMDAIDLEYGKHMYSQCIYEDYEVESITGIIVLDEKDNAAAVVGEGNSYQIVDNFLLHGKTNAEIEIIAEALLNIISGTTFVPIDLDAAGIIEMELGDFIQVNMHNGSVSTFVLQHTISGIQSLHDNIVADCTQYVTDDKNTLASAIQYMKATQEKTSMRVGTLEADHVSTSTITAINGQIDNLQTNKLNTSDLSAQVATLGYATVGQLNATNVVVSQKLNANELSSAITNISMVTIGGSLTIGAYLAQWQSMTVKDENGKNVTINYLGHA